MNIIFLSSSLNQGGIETFFCRIAKQIQPEEHKLIFMYMEAPESQYIVQALKGSGHLVAEGLSLRHELLLSGLGFSKIKQFQKKNKLQEVDVLFATSAETLIAAVYLQNNYFPSAKIALGFYNPFMIASPKHRSYYFDQLCQKIVTHLPPQNLIFINDGIKIGHQKNMKLDFNGSHLFPILIDLDKFSRVKRIPEKYKIVSVGRLVKFKTYNFTMIDVVKALNQVDPRFIYHIYGDGDMKPILVEYIKKTNAEHCVFLFGEVPYEKLPDIFSDAFVFVGCGTALIEAGATGLPSIPATIYAETAVTYGWFHQGADYDFGEIREEKPPKLIADLILELAQYSAEQYEEVSRQTILKAENFDIKKNINAFLNILKKLKAKKISFKLYEPIFFYFSGIISRLKFHKRH